jgi:hypothetical protein
MMKKMLTWKNVSITLIFIEMLAILSLIVLNIRQQEMMPLGSLHSFPSDLKSPYIEFYGIYDDGWVSKESSFVLLPTPDEQLLRVKGFIPMINDEKFLSTMTLKLNGKVVKEQTVGVGNFNIKVKISQKQGPQRISLTFSDVQVLPNKDGRLIGGKINYIGFSVD